MESHFNPIHYTIHYIPVAGVKGIAKRAAKDTAKAAIGVDQSAVNQRADRSQDREHSVRDVISNLSTGAGERQKKEGS